MVTMSYIWDRTTEVLRGRAGMLASIVALLSFLPRMVQIAIVAAQGGMVGGGLAAVPATPAAAFSFVGFVVGIAVALLGLWGNVSLVAAASDPAVDRPAALAIGARRLPTVLGLSLLLVLLFVLLAIPFVVLLGASAFNYSALLRGGVPTATGMTPSAGGVGLALLYLLVLLVFGVWLLARLLLLTPVVANERRGFGSFARSFELTRGLTWRIIGVLILFGIVFIVAAGAAQAVTGIVFRLLLGAEHAGITLFLTGAVGAAIGCVFAVISGTFIAQLYRATSGHGAAETFR